MGISRRILVVEDDALLRGLISAMLTAKGFSVQVAGNAAEARKIASEFDPDLALLDIELGAGPSGVDLASALRVSQPSIALVFLTHIPEPRLFGIDSKQIPRDAGYLYKEKISDPGVLEVAIESVLRGKSVNSYRDDKSPEHRFSKMSRSQLEVIKLVALGLTNSQIAAERGTSIRAVENLLQRAFAAANIEVAEGEHARVKIAREFIKTAGIPTAK